MGKVGAYLTLGREAHHERPSQETQRDFVEFAKPLPLSEQQNQASRCMFCGVAFCQTGLPFAGKVSGCPLHNLIPEWNDLVYRGQMADAADRLALTSPLPEFTSRVCPAPCEAACNLGLNEEPTTIKDDERAIVDWAWEHNHTSTRPLAPAPKDAKRVAVVGSGPAGLTAAWELTRQGFKVVVFEKSDAAGGLLMYGIPNMKLPKELVERRVRVMEASGIEFRLNTDATDAAVAQEITSNFDAVIVAAGAGAARGLAAKGFETTGVHFALEYLSASTKAVKRLRDTGTVPDLPADQIEKLVDPELSAKGKDVIVIGGGDTGTDCVATAIRQGAKSVSQFEFLPEPSETRSSKNPWPEWPMIKKTDYGQVEARVRDGKDPRSWGIDTLAFHADDKGHLASLDIVQLDWSQGKPERVEGSEQTLPAQLVLIACGFTGPEKTVLESLGLSVTEVRGGARPTLADSIGHRIVSEGARDIPFFACGDTKNGASLVVTAMADALSCAREVAQSLK